MFTGIVQGRALVTSIESKNDALIIEIDLGPFADNLKEGASVSVSGVCLTVTKVQDTRVYFFAMGETLEKTTIGTLKIGEHVNIERSAKFSDEIGGHIVSGHITGKAKIDTIEVSSDNCMMKFVCPTDWMPYLLPKGFVALDGCSLTIVDVGCDWFTVHLIPETRSRTTFGMKQVGNEVNLEIDPMTRAIVDTVSRLAQK